MRLAFLAARSRPVIGLLLAGIVAASGEANRLPGQPPAVPGQPAAKAGALPPLNPAAVDEAVSRAVESLRRTQKSDGSWGEGDYVLGYTALAGLALIESGIRTSDPAVVRAANYVRSKAGPVTHTYQLSLSILFLDRVKDSKRDGPFIQMLAARLLAGQTETGGWTYETAGGVRNLPKIYEADAKRLIAALNKMTRAAPPSLRVSYRERPSALNLCIKTSDDIVVKPSKAALGIEELEKKRAAVIKSLPAHLKKIAVFRDPGKFESLDPEAKAKFLEKEKGDNSNTHFAMIGLWAARRHGVPTERVFELVARRYRTSQDGGSGGWGYGYPKDGSTPSMTCVALLGLAIGNALGVDPAAGRPEQDQAILKSLTYLSKNVGAPTGKFVDRPKVKDAGGLYYFWALERIAVLYDIRTLDQKDWYRWGAEILIANQLADGSWKDAMVHGDNVAANTALAILFLKRANLTPDLSKRLIVDSSALMAKVNVPKSEPPPPPKPTPPPLTVPEPPKAVEPPPKPAEPVAAPAVISPSVASEPAPAAKPRSPLWPWLAGGIGLILAICLGLFLLLRKKAGDDEEDEKPKSKKAKNKSKKH